MFRLAKFLINLVNLSIVKAYTTITNVTKFIKDSMNPNTIIVLVNSVACFRGRFFNRAYFQSGFKLLLLINQYIINVLAIFI